MKTAFSLFLTGDIHGRASQSARLYTLYRREREKAESEGRTCLFFDAGDTSDRKEDYCSLTFGTAYTRIINSFNYDALVVGNDVGMVYGPEKLKTVVRRLNAPVLGANFRNGLEPLLEGLTENLILEAAGIKLGIFGLTSPWNRIYEGYGYFFPDMKQVASRQVEALKSRGADVILMLSHLGLDEDLRIAGHLPAIDLVLGGHSHALSPRGVFTKHGVLIHHTGKYGEYLGRVDFDFNRDTGRAENKSASVIPVDPEEKEAAEILAALDEAREEGRQAGMRIAGTCPRFLDLGYWEDCGLGRFAADALRAHYGAEAAMVASGNFHQALRSGQISLADLNQSCFSTANPCLSRITGAALREALERGWKEDFSHLYHPGLRGAPLGIPQISGIQARVDPSDPRGPRLTGVWVNGEPLNEKREYSLAHTDLENHPHLGYLPRWGHHQEAMDPTLFLRDILEEGLASDQDPGCPSRRWITSGEGLPLRSDAGKGTF